MNRAVILIFITLKITTSFALDLTPNGIYRATKEACLQLADLDLNSSAYDRIKAGYFPTREYMEIMTFIRSESFKKAVNDMDFSEHFVVGTILKQSEFHRAIAECAKDNKQLKNIFIDSVIRSDKAGKSLGAFIILVSLRGWASIFKKFPNKLKVYSIGFQKYLVTFFGLSFLERDTFQSNTQKVQQAQLTRPTENNKDHLQAIFSSIQEQVFTEEEKIKACGQCSEHDQLVINRDALLELLKVVEKNRVESN